MASIHKEILIMAPGEAVWDAARDVGALHTRLVPGFVAETTILAGLDPVVRRVTFGDGLEVRETIVDLDDRQRRLVWTVESERVEHHNGSLQVFDAGPGASRAVWIADVLPHAIAETFGGMMEQGLAAMKRQLEAVAARPA
jgi:hypothetical protein